MKKILITGGLGNLGSWITAHFCREGYEVYVLTKNKRELTESLNIKLLYADITKIEELRPIFSENKFEYIIHTASVNDGFVNGYSNLSLEVNALGSRNILECIKDDELKHFIYFSTFQVYGKYDGTISEETPTLPKHDYGTTHLFAEIYLKQFHKTHNLPYTIIRLTNSYGAPKDYDSSKWYLVLNDLSKSAFNNKEVVLKSNGKAPRDFIWMGTVAETMQQLVELPEATNDTFNLSGQNTLEMLDVAYAVQLAYKEKYGVEIPVKTNTEDSTTYPTDLYVTSEKLRKIVKFDDRIMFKEEAIKIFNLLEKES